jgi:guanylate kinase
MENNFLNLFILSGPSGAGEDSVIEGLKKCLPIERVVTSTTRKPRAGESQGNPYYFLSHQEFQQKIEAGEMVEYAQEYNNNYYGVTKMEIERVLQSGRIGIWKIEWKGVITAKKLYPEICAIFLMTENLETLERRIRRRDSGISDNYVKERMEYTKEWLTHKDIYDYTVINKENKLEEAIEEVRAIIEKRRPKHR